YTRAFDKAGNAEVPPGAPDAQVTVLYDTTAPVTSNDAPGGWQNHDVTVTLSPTDSGPAGGVSGVDKTYYKVDAGSFVVGSSVLIAAPADHSKDGVHTITYYSTDKAGNVEANQSVDVRIDTVKPVSSASGPNQVTNSSPFTINYSASDAAPSSSLDKVELWVKGPSASVYSLADTDTSPDTSQSFSYAPAGEGTYSFYTRAFDKAGNAEVPPGAPDAQVTVLCDTTAPVTSNDAPGGWQNHDVTVTLSPTDSGPAGGVSGVDKTYYKVDAGSFVVGSSVLIAAPADHSKDGVHTITYYSTDKAGNVEANQSVDVRIDTVRPSANIA